MNIANEIENDQAGSDYPAWSFFFPFHIFSQNDILKTDCKLFFRS